ncbi:MAG: hypothetical protein R6V57_16335 [Vicinamibacterales bacterium]
MTAKTRYFLIGSVMVLTVGLSIGLVAFYGGMPSGFFSSQRGPEELKYLPGDSAVVAYANVRDVMNSELRQRLRKLEGVTDEGRSEFKTRTGIDIEQDIDHVVASMGTPGPDAGHARHAGLVVVTGRFDASKIEAMALEHGGRTEQYKGKRLLVVSRHAKSEEPGAGAEMAMGFLDQGVVAIGTADMVRRAVDRGAGGDNVPANDEMMRLVGGMSGESMWAVGRFDALSAQAAIPAGVSERIPPLTWFSASGRVNGGLQAVVKAEAKDEQAAENLRDIIRGFVALAKMQTGSRPGIQKMMPDVQLSGDGKEVAISFAVTNDMLDAFEAARAMGEQMKQLEK